MDNYELLSPAGSFSALRQAIYNGADAVYLGLDKFGARAKSENFNADNLRDAVNFAHLYGVKVYITFNTLVKEEETAEFMQYVDLAAQCKADAFIVQSMGMGALIHKAYPGAVLHASTQMGIHNTWGAKLCKDNGFARVILSREVTLRDINFIKSQVDIELEVFIHGAMCVSFSGGCFMSSFLSQNSGNRGKCLQPCRTLFKSGADNFGEKQYLLSLSDLCVGEDILKLREAGVSSFKIEGRMRRPEYAGYTARFYRKILEGEKPTQKDYEDLKSLYNRGNFTRGHYFGGENIASPLLQGHMGAEAGSVAGVPAFGTIRVKSKRPLAAGDAFKVLRSGREIGNAVYSKKTGDDIFELSYRGQNAAAGDSVNITTDSALISSLCAYEKMLPVDMRLTVKAGQKPVLTVSHKGIAAVCEGDSAALVAENTENHGKLRRDILEKLSKLGGTEFELQNAQVNVQPDAFVPISVVNGLRRKGINLLKEQIIRRFEHENGLTNMYNSYTAENGLTNVNINLNAENGLANINRSCNAGNGQTNVNRSCNAENGQANINTNLNAVNGAVAVQADSLLPHTITDIKPYQHTHAAGKSALLDAVNIACISDDFNVSHLDMLSAFIFKPKDYDEGCFRRFFESGAGEAISRDKLYLYLPHIITDSDAKMLLPLIRKFDIKGIYVNNISGLELGRQERLKVFGGVGLNVFNSADVDFVSRHTEFHTLSQELSRREIASVKNGSGSYVFGYGNIQLMALSHCILRKVYHPQEKSCAYEGGFALTDRINASFAVNRHKLSRCYFSVYNGKKLNIFSKPVRLNNILIDVCGESREQAGRLIEGIFSRTYVCADMTDFTGGHMYRGVY